MSDSRYFLVDIGWETVLTGSGLWRVPLGEAVLSAELEVAVGVPMGAMLPGWRVLTACLAQSGNRLGDERHLH